MKVRAATPEDLAAIAEIQALSPEASQWEPESYLNYDCTVATGKRVIGFLVTRQTAPGEREILNLAVDPSQRRRGVGSGDVTVAYGAGRIRAVNANKLLRLDEARGVRVREPAATG